MFDMDYKELIAEIRESNVDGNASIERWATAIETLLAERDAALEDLKIFAPCLSCLHREKRGIDMPCLNCNKRNWQWRGIQEVCKSENDN